MKPRTDTPGSADQDPSDKKKRRVLAPLAAVALLAFGAYSASSNNNEGHEPEFSFTESTDDSHEARDIRHQAHDLFRQLEDAYHDNTVNPNGRTAQLLPEDQDVIVDSSAHEVDDVSIYFELGGREESDVDVITITFGHKDIDYGATSFEVIRTSDIHIVLDDGQHAREIDTPEDIAILEAAANAFANKAEIEESAAKVEQATINAQQIMASLTLDYNMHKRSSEEEPFLIELSPEQMPPNVRPELKTLELSQQEVDGRSGFALTFTVDGVAEADGTENNSDMHRITFTERDGQFNIGEYSNDLDTGGGLGDLSDVVDPSQLDYIAAVAAMLSGNK